MLSKYYALLSIFIILILSSSCSIDSNIQTQRDITASGFRGVYRDDFQHIAEEYDGNDFVYRIIQDENITKEELDEAFDKYDGCVKSKGFVAIYDTPGSYKGGHTYSFNHGSVYEDGQKALKAENECNQKFGFNDLSPLQDEILANPNKEDFNKIMAECLVRHGMAPEGYTANDFANDNENETGVVKEYIGVTLDEQDRPPKEKQDMYYACQNNPLE
jgi:hypothetical protein